MDVDGNMTEDQFEKLFYIRQGCDFHRRVPMMWNTKLKSYCNVITNKFYSTNCIKYLVNVLFSLSVFLRMNDSECSGQLFKSSHCHVAIIALRLRSRAHPHVVET